MKISCIQMDMRLGETDWNFARAQELVRAAVSAEHPDVAVLPETWNTGFFPKDLASCADKDGERTKAVFSALARELNVNIVCGSVANRRAEGYFNTACVFDRTGAVAAEYDKTHLFTPSGEHESFRRGGHTCRFTLDGRRCGLIICYDIRFPELTRTMALEGMDLLFVVAQWPEKRTMHLETLARARAIENQMFLALCNSVGTAGETRCGGHSAVIDPWGEYLAKAGDQEETITAEADFSVIEGIRSSINVFRDRRPELYRCGHTPEKRKTFYVFQGNTFDRESDGGYIWAPILNKAGGTFHHWERLKDVRPGDIIFHGYNGNIQAISVALGTCYNCDQPVELRSENLWERTGRRVDCNYVIIRNPVQPKSCLSDILRFCDVRYAPFDRNGKGNVGYLYELNRELARIFLCESIKYNPELITLNFVQELLSEGNNI